MRLMRMPSKIKKQKFENILPKMSIEYIDEATFVIEQKMWRTLSRKKEKAEITWYETRHQGTSVTGSYWIDWRFTYQTSTTKKSKDFLRFLYKLRHKTKEKWIVLIIDNASIHKSKVVVEYCDGCYIVLVYLPPYSPEYNKIEFLWKQLKRWFRKIQRNYDKTQKAIKVATNAIKEDFKRVDISQFINTLDS